MLLITYTVRANIKKWLKEDTEDDTFDIKAGGRTIAVDMVFNKEVYTSGDSVQIDVQTALPEGASAVSAYSLKITSGGQTMWQEVRTDNIFGYDIPENFEGQLRFEADVYNPDGDSGEDTDFRYVRHVVVLINAEPQLYSAGQTITANYQLISNRVEANEERYFFYIVTDPASNIVLEGEVVSTAKTGSFQYQVPDVASPYYDFRIIANVEIIVDSDRYRVSEDAFDVVYRISGYALTITFDKGNYSVGETAIIHYTIVAHGDAVLPQTFDLHYELHMYSPKSLSTTWPQGDLTYPITSDIPNGPHWFILEDYSTGTIDIKTIIIGPEGPPIIEIEDFDDDGVPDSADLDDDNDGYSDLIEEEEGSNPKNATSKPSDNDEDYIPDSMDVDDDNDGYSDGEEAMAGSDPLDSTSVPTEKEISIPPRDVWEWLVPMIMGAVAIAVALMALVLVRRPSKAQHREPEEVEESPDTEEPR